ncbi:hypothetical protein LOTGIDRAFT_107140 [Lottia gigantea]|uniref:C-mannosyltransferase DPY19L3 n=1 Tax=Lottia gigantea TaxID=225164 RepID=V3ZXF1_LOTGI|nr:hypothetical protein LOTGIDRAFT_107140 [Lottia gigantea]ESO87300.1 hypothetical protein LOTGIDRAFT_107140 [Lottia gigantea]
MGDAKGDHVRKRKTTGSVSKTEYEAYVSNLYNKQVKKPVITPTEPVSKFTIFNCLLGLIVMMFCGAAHSWYMRTLHENTLWFTNIKEVEREISFRTESGLFYSYYKQLIQSKSISQGVQSLVRDNHTEYPSTINILQRMNIYQEVILASLYKFLAIQSPPIFFYVYSVFNLQAVLIGGIFCMAWMLADNWLAGVLAAIFYAINKENTTRVEFTTPLRECFALPFLWVQIAAISYFFKKNISRIGERISLLFIGSSTFLFCICWQFNQFIMLLQLISLFGVWVLDFIPSFKIQRVLFMQLLSLFTVFYLQYYNTMLLGGLWFSFLLSFYIVIFIKVDKPSQSSVTVKLLRVIGYSLLVLSLTFIFHFILKWFLQVDADEHIFKFLINKMGYGNPRDFDSRLYLCLDIFNMLSWSFYTSLTSGVVFPLYTIVHTVLLLYFCSIFLISSSSNTEKRLFTPETKDSLLSYRPELAFHTVQATMFGILAITTMRMKYLWTPYMCVFAGFLVGGKHLYKTVLFFTSNEKLVCIFEYFLHLLRFWMPTIQKEMEDLREFWDPDTVELMEWIKKSTKPIAAFSGSMQLLAGVKLCSGRPVTNHPHYEDKQLREKTKWIYQMYGKREPVEVYTILKKYQTDYIILEDSICLSYKTDSCSTPDIIDLNNGMIPVQGKMEPGLVNSAVPRFCDEIRHGSPKFTKYFKLVFSNKTFRVYKLLK